MPKLIAVSRDCWFLDKNLSFTHHLTFHSFSKFSIFQEVAAESRGLQSATVCEVPPRGLAEPNWPSRDGRDTLGGTNEGRTRHTDRERDGHIRRRRPTTPGLQLRLLLFCFVSQPDNVRPGWIRDRHTGPRRLAMYHLLLAVLYCPFSSWWH